MCNPCSKIFWRISWDKYFSWIFGKYDAVFVFQRVQFEVLIDDIWWQFSFLLTHLSIHGATLLMSSSPCKDLVQNLCFVKLASKTTGLSWGLNVSRALSREVLMGEGNKQPPLCWLPLWVVELGLVAESCTNIGSLYIICQHNSSTP